MRQAFLQAAARGGGQVLGNFLSLHTSEGIRIWTAGDMELPGLNVRGGWS